MALLQTDVARKMEEDPDAFLSGYYIISEDNFKQHAAWRKSQPADRVNKIPPRSPDIHKIVEHPLKVFDEHRYPEFTLDRKCKSAMDAMAKAAEVLTASMSSPLRRFLTLCRPPCTRLL